MPGHPTETPREVSLAIVGSGGAGVMTTGELVLRTAAACGLYGLMTKGYGPQIRGGESACFLRLGTRPFDKQAEMIDVLVAFDFRNAARFHEEVFLTPEAWILHEQSEGDRPPDVFKVGRQVPVGWKQLASGVEGKGRPNIVSLGVLCSLLGIPETIALQVLAEHFQDKGAAVVEENQRSFQTGTRWAGEKWTTSPFLFPAEKGRAPRWVLTGNQAVVIGSLVGGCEFYAGYPITPATDVMEDLSQHLPRRGGVLVQAEDELAAVNMAIGASFGGKKAMTATSGPGFSLMAEGLGLAVMAEIPLVVVDVQRAGPSTGIPTKTEQSDLWAAISSSHGDNPRVVLAPSSLRGCIEQTVAAFNLAERYQVPVILLSDQFLGSRAETVEPMPLATVATQTRRLAENPAPSSFRRYAFSDDGILPMSVPGIAGGEYTAEGLEHDERGWPDASHAMHQRQSERRLRKLDPLAAEAGWIEQCGDPAATVGLIGWGSTAGVIRETTQVALDDVRVVKGIIPHLLFPPQTDLLNRLFEGLGVLYVVELSSMGQFLRYLRAFYRLPPTVVPIARAGGRPFRTEELLAALEPARALPGRE